MNSIENDDLNTVNILQRLIRFDTTNPPGNEEECIYFVQSVLKSANIDCEIYFNETKRANLVARIEGNGKSLPLLLYGHIDVVTTSQNKWKYPPFEGVIAENCIWGRGALDMKGGISMMLSSILKIKSEGIIPPGDIVFAIVSDEEVGGSGAMHLVKKHKELFEGIEHAIGEFGGYTMYMLGKRFYPIIVSEKQFCSVKVVFKGESGHASRPIKNGAMAKTGRFLKKISEKNCQHT